MAKKLATKDKSERTRRRKKAEKKSTVEKTEDAKKEEVNYKSPLPDPVCSVRYEYGRANALVVPKKISGKIDAILTNVSIVGAKHYDSHVSIVTSDGKQHKIDC